MAGQKLIVLSGKVSGLDRSYGNCIRFRIDNRPLVCYMQPNIVDGDPVKVVIDDKPEATVIALRNESTKIYYGPGATENPKLSIGMILIGVLLIPCVGVGLFIIWMAWDKYQGEFRLRDYAHEVKTMMG